MNRPLPDVVGGVTVERRHVSYLGAQADISGQRRGVLHVTVSPFESAHNEFLEKFAPNVLIGYDAKKNLRCIEYAGVGVIAHALENTGAAPETNTITTYQIEVAAKPRQDAEMLQQPELRVLDAKLRNLLAKIMSQVAKTGGVPLVRGGDGTRNFNRWLGRSGWFGHKEVPDQPSGHWDPGGHDYDKTFALAIPEHEYKLVVMDGEGNALAQSGKFQKGDLGSLMRFTVGDRDFEDDIRPELWDDGDVVLRLKRA